MPPPKTNVLRGTLDLPILKALAAGPLHGLAISQRIEQITKALFQVGPGSLFPALHRMEEAGWLFVAWGESENKRSAKFYTLTKAGRKELRAAALHWRETTEIIARFFAAREESR